jgi:hypothetical protein
MTRPASGTRLKHWDGRSVDLLECDFDRHSDFDAVWVAANNIGCDARSFDQLHHRNHVRNSICKHRVRRSSRHCERVDNAATAGRFPGELVGSASWTVLTRIEDVRATTTAKLQQKLAARSGIPELLGELGGGL